MEDRHAMSSLRNPGPRQRTTGEGEDRVLQATHEPGRLKQVDYSADCSVAGKQRSPIWWLR